MNKFFLIPVLGIIVFAGAFLFSSNEAHAAAILSCAKSNTSAYTVYTTWGYMPAYRVVVTNSADDLGTITSLDVTPSGTANDTAITLRFFRDLDDDGIVESGDTDLGASAAFEADNTEQTFNITDITISNYGTETILILASGAGLTNANTFTLTVQSTDVTVTDSDNTCADGGMGANANALTVSSTAPSIAASNGSNNPAATTIINSETIAVHQIKFVNSSTTSDVITAIQFMPSGSVAEQTDTDFYIYLDDGSTAGEKDGTDTLLTLTSNEWTDDNNTATTFTLTTGHGIQVPGSGTVNILAVIVCAGSASNNETYVHLLASTTAATGVDVTGTLMSNTFTVDTVAPTISAVYSADSDNDGKTDAFDIQFSETMLDSSLAQGISNFEFDTDALNDNDASEVAAEAGTSTIVFPSADSDANDEYYRVRITTNGSELATTGTVYLHFTQGMMAIFDTAGNSMTACAACGTEYDAARPVLMGAGVDLDANGLLVNTVTLTFSENVYLDNTNQDGTLDAGDTTSDETFTSTASLGGIDSAGSIENIGNFATTGNYTQSAETCNTITVSAWSTVTISFNTVNNTAVSGCHFTAGTTVPSGNFTLDTANPIDGNTYIYGIGGYNATAKKMNLNGLVIASVAGSSGFPWDTTKTEVATVGTPSTTYTNITVRWTAIANARADFSRYEIYYNTSPGVTSTTGTAWTSSNDTNLTTVTTTTTTITGLASGTTYYYVVYAIDGAGNLSSVTESSIGTPGGSSAYMDRTPPALPTNIHVSLSKEGYPYLTWTDPADLDLDKVIILRGKNELPVSGDKYASINADVQEYTDKNVSNGDVVKYIFRTKDKSTNHSGNSEQISITVKIDESPPGIEFIEATDRTELVITFTEAIDPESVTPEAFAISDEDGNNLEIENVKVDANQIILTTGVQSLGVAYSLDIRTFEDLVTPITDLSGNAIGKAQVSAADSEFVGAPAAPFTDVTVADHAWALSAIEWARTSGYIVGREKGKFVPGDKVVRIEIATMIAKAILPEGEKDLIPDDTAKFNDTHSQAWYTPYINYLYAHGITKGRQPGLFIPSGYAFRSEVITMLVRYLETLDKFKSKIANINMQVGLGLWDNPFFDVENDSWYARTIAIANYYGILQGTEINGELYAFPKERINRAETTTMLKRAVDLVME